MASLTLLAKIANAAERMKFKFLSLAHQKPTPLILFHITLVEEDWNHSHLMMGMYRKLPGGTKNKKWLSYGQRHN